jgi:hypothetical protein
MHLFAVNNQAGKFQSCFIPLISVTYATNKRRSNTRISVLQGTRFATSAESPPAQ